MPDPHSFTRVVIEDVYPEIEEGRFPAKRVQGETFGVWADIFMDGHDHLKAVLCYAYPGEKNWREVPMTHLGNDRWQAHFLLSELGITRYTVKAWPDQFGTWQSDTRKKLAAGQDIGLEIIEGRQLIERLMGGKGKKRKALLPLQNLLDRVDDATLRDELLSDQTAELVAAYAPREGGVAYRALTVWVDRELAEFSAWYELFPRSQSPEPGRSGTFADCEARLPDIAAMGFDVVYFPPIHPIGVTHRKGRNNALAAEPGDPGSPYAIGGKEGGHKSIHPDLGTMDDFRRFVESARDHGLEVALDFAVQCSPDHPYLKEHSEWFIVRPDGTIKYAENPPKKYQDIVNVNFAGGHAPALWEELRSIIQFWVDEGVTIFRVDNPHTKPFDFWEWLIDSIHETHPEIIFLSEAFTRPKVMYRLAKLGFTQSYTYFTWRNTKAELTEYLTELTTDWPKEFFRPNFFPVTPDIFPYYLHDSGRAGYVARLALAATLGSNYGMLAGYELLEAGHIPGKEEYIHSEKYELKVRDWNAPGNIKEFVTRLNRIRRENPALQQFKNLSFEPSSSEHILFYRKWSRDGRNHVFAAVNLDPRNPHDTHITMPLKELNIGPDAAYRLDDLLLGHSWEWKGARQHLRLDPATNPIALFRINQ